MCGSHFTYPHIFLLKFLSARSTFLNIYIYTLPTMYVGYYIIIFYMPFLLAENGKEELEKLPNLWIYEGHTCLE
jgi:hypothetical protein